MAADCRACGRGEDPPRRSDTRPRRGAPDAFGKHDRRHLHCDERDDFICADALQILPPPSRKNRLAKAFYSDEYEADSNSVRQSPFFKPDFDPVMVMNCCYPAGLLAIDMKYLRQLAARPDYSASLSHDYHPLAEVCSGTEPVHVRELLYARRGGPNWNPAAASQRAALTWFLAERALDQVLSVEPNPLAASAGSWKLTARKPLPNVEVLNARDVWASLQALRRS
jgi:hypothetical protein